MANLMCKIFGHKWKYLYSQLLRKPFKECKRCGEQDNLTDKELKRHKS